MQVLSRPGSLWLAFVYLSCGLLLHFSVVKLAKRNGVKVGNGMHQNVDSNCVSASLSPESQYDSHTRPPSIVPIKRSPRSLSHTAEVLEKGARSARPLLPDLLFHQHLLDTQFSKQVLLQ